MQKIPMEKFFSHTFFAYINHNIHIEILTAASTFFIALNPVTSFPSQFLVAVPFDEAKQSSFFILNIGNKLILLYKLVILILSS